MTVCALSFDQGFYKSGASATLEKKAYLGRRRCTNPRRQSNRAVSSIFLPAAEYEQGGFGIVLSRDDPSNKTSHLVARDLVTNERNPIFPMVIIFWGIK